ncbi:MAG: hypothetical protein ACRCTZ_11135 [Sarcina sp.]
MKLKGENRVIVEIWKDEKHMSNEYFKVSNIVLLKVLYKLLGYDLVVTNEVICFKSL